jgi:hypothetical protein
MPIIMTAAIMPAAFLLKSLLLLSIRKDPPYFLLRPYPFLFENSGIFSKRAEQKRLLI